MSNRVMQKEILSDFSNNRIGEELEEIYDDFALLQQLYSAGIKEIRTKLEILDDEFHVRHAHNPIHHMEYRLKSPKSILGKLKKKDLDISIDSIYENLYDIAGIRVICNYVEDIYVIADLLTKQDDIRLIRTKDYIKHPKENGYRSLHLVIEVPIFLANATRPVFVEVQIRTIAMDFWASLEHELRYKTDVEVPDNIRQELIECANTIDKLDNKMQSIHKRLKNDKVKELN